MDIILTTNTFSLITGLVSGNNFMILFIALVIVFFLLGLLFGINIANGKRNANDKSAPAIDDIEEKIKKPDALEQSKREIDQKSNNTNNEKPPVKNYGYYNNYW